MQGLQNQWRAAPQPCLLLEELWNSRLLRLDQFILPVVLGFLGHVYHMFLSSLTAGNTGKK